MTILDSVATWLRGIALLRHGATVSAMQDLLAARRQIELLRRDFAGVHFHPDIVVKGLPEGRLQIANGVRIEKGAVLSLGDEHNGFGQIGIGANTWIGQYNNLRTAASEIRIGEGCLISQFCSLIAANHDIRRDRPIRDRRCVSNESGVTIEDDVWLGAGTVVLPGITVHRGAVVGAGSVVAKDVPSYEIWAGAAARKIGERE